MSEPREIGRVLVTGGASGLGRAIADAVAEAGGSPVVLDLDDPETGHPFIRADLADPRGAEAAVNAAVEQHGELDGVITAAGTDACGELHEVEADAWDRVIAVNLVGTAAVVRAALPSLENRRGRIVTVASTLGWRALPAATAYCASKFGVVGFTRALSAELAGRVGVTLLLPGGMDTHFFDGRPDKYRPPEDMRLAPPEAVAGAAIQALQAPDEAMIRELMVYGPDETSWP